MSDQLEYIEELILASLAGKVSAKDQAFLDEMITASPEVAALMEEHRQIARQLKPSHRKSFAWQQIQQAITQEKAKKKNSRMVPYALFTGIAILVVAGLVFFSNTGRHTNEQPGTADQLTFILRDSAYPITGTITRTNAADIEFTNGTLNIIRKAGINTQARIHVPKKMDVNLRLADGTMVTLNAASDLSFPLLFTGDKRQVALAGEGFFRVVHNPANPFIVQTTGMEVEVKGTQFNVKAYPGESLVTSLTQGAVVINGNVKNVHLRPGQSAVQTNESLKINSLDSASVLGWMNGVYVFTDEKLATIDKTLNRWFDYSFYWQDRSIDQIRFSGEMNKNQSLETFLQPLCRSADLGYQLEGRRIRLYRKG